MADVLGFATSGGRNNPKAIASSRGTQKDINAMQKNAGVLGSVIGQGDDDSYKQFQQQQKQKQQAQQQQQQAQQQIQQQQQQQSAKSNSLLSRVKGAAVDVGKAARAVARPVADVGGAIGQEIQNKPVTNAGKFVHDTAQLSSDVSGGTVNQFAKGVAQAPGVVAGEIASQSKNPYVRAQGVQAVQGAQKKAFGTNDSGTIAKKIIGSTAGTATMFLGGGEGRAATVGAKSLLSKGAKVTFDRIGKDSIIGGTGNVASTLTTDPKAKAGDLAKSYLIGSTLGGIAPVAVKGAGTALSKGSEKLAADAKVQSLLDKTKLNSVPAALGKDQAVNDLINKQKGQSLLTKAGPSLDANTEKSLHSVMANVHTPKAVTEAAAARDASAKETAVQAEKAAGETKKIDQQLEVYGAKAKDNEGKLTNVDQVKIKQLQDRRAELNPEQSTATPKTAEATAAIPPTEGSLPKSAAATPDNATLLGKVKKTNNDVNLPQTEKSAAATTAQPVDQNAVSTIQQHMAEHYQPATDHANEAFAHEHLTAQTEKALSDYQVRTKKIFGSDNIVAGDEAKHVVPNMGPDKSSHYHEPTSQFAKGYYKHLLANPETTDKPVMITAGGTGAGKTSALKKKFNDNGIDPNRYAAIVDTNLTSLHSATSRIEPALATGRSVTVQFVYRDPLEAYHNGVIPRSVKEGRTVTAAQHADTHAGSINTIKQLAEHYKDNPNVSIEIIDNSRGAGNSKTVTLDFLRDKSYTKNELEEKIHTLLDEQLSKGKLTNEQHAIFKDQQTTTEANGVAKNGSDVQRVESTGKSQAGSQSKQERQTGQIAETGTRTLRPSETAHMPEVGGYTHSEHMAQDYADMLRSQEQSAKGGQIIKNDDGSYKRTSEHSRFYRDFYKENGKAPTKADYLEQAKKELESHKDGIGAGKDYQTLREREAKPVPRVTVESTVKDVPQGTSKVAQRVARDLKDQYGDLAQYDRVNIKDQANKAEALIADREKLDKVISGEAPLPDGLRATSVIAAVRNNPELLKDVGLLKRLASSPLASESSYSAQELRIAAENAKHDPITAIRQIKDARAKAFERKSKTTATKAVNDEVRQIQAAKPRVTKETWSSFVDSLKC